MRIDPNNFDPRELARSLESEVQRKFNLEGWKPVNITSSVEYYVPGSDTVVCPNSVLWEFEDSAPWFLRTKRYLEHWRDEIETKVLEVTLWISGIEKAVIIKPDDAMGNLWPSKGGPSLIQ